MFGGGLYLKNSSDLETGVTCSSAVGGASSLAVGAKYSLGKDASLRAKVDCGSQVRACLQPMTIYPTMMIKPCTTLNTSCGQFTIHSSLILLEAKFCTLYLNVEVTFDETIA